MNIKLHLKYFFITLILIICTGSLFAQSNNFFNQRDDQYRLLGLKRAKEAFEIARVEYERQMTLFEKDLITRAELDRARGIFSDAEVNYQQSLLAVLFEKQYVSVKSAIKYYDDKGVKHVALTLSNTSGGSEEFRKLLNIDDQLFRSLQPDLINNIYVSLMNDDGAIIGQPYETKITQLKYGEPQKVDFRLLQDVDAVTVFLIYGNGSQRSMKIFLQKDATGNKVEIQSEQFSQEVELGKTASYDLTLELFSGVSNKFTLEVVNLPEEINRFITSSSGRERLRQVKFTESSRSKQAVLQITLPDRSTGSVAMDESIPFYVLALPDDQADLVTVRPKHQWTERELDSLDIGYTKLELIPRGAGLLVVRAPQLYHSILPDETVELTLELVNEGSRRIDQIEVKADPPLNWTKQIEPTNVPKLDISEDTNIKLKFTPPENIAVGKYEIRIQTSGLSFGRPVNGTDKIATIEIRSQSNVVGTVLIVMFILVIVGGIVVFGIRLSRK